MKREFLKRYYKMKNYIHFDKRIHFSKVRRWIENEHNIPEHSFLPFLHDTLSFIKYDGSKKTPKERQIYIASHKDRYIFERYAFLLNKAYNIKAKSLCINNSSIAYRDCLGKNNIHFAKEVFDFIRCSGHAWVVVGDFTDFFDQLNHKYLKEQIQKLLDVRVLPDDHYAVFKNSTKFSYVDREDILKYTGLSKRDLRKKSQIFTADEFRKFRESTPKMIKKNVKLIGVPQGSPISSIYSNVYMMEFDQLINTYVTGRMGLYRRYSDDFIIVVPKKIVPDIKELWAFIDNTVMTIPDLVLQEKKTHIYEYDGSAIIDRSGVLLGTGSAAKNSLDYLGFTFDGINVKIRDKTIHKYYNRMYRKIQFVNRYSLEHGKNVSRKRLYLMYSHLGQKSRKKHQGNFLSYVDRAQRIFGSAEPINGKTKKHWMKMHSRLELI